MRLEGWLRSMDSWPSFETPRKSATPRDEAFETPCNVRGGDKVKTNRRDALSLAKLLRADELTAVWVPDGPHEAMRDLTRARETAMLDLRTKRQHVSAFLLRLGRPYPESKNTWTKAHVSWIASQKLEHPQQRLVLEEMMLAIRQA